MILGTIIFELTKKLDALGWQDGRSISSHEEAKEEALRCLMNIIMSAPESEYIDLIGSEFHEILLGYLLSILCRIATNDKSKSIRLHAIVIIDTLIGRLNSIHEKQNAPEDRCSITILILSLPGVFSAIFKLLVGDTKLPKMLLVKSVKTLASLIAVAFSNCDHLVEANMLGGPPPKLSGQNLIETCDNLAPRIGHLIDYVCTNCDDIQDEVKVEMLDFCLVMVTKTRPELLTRALKPIVNYFAFISSNLEGFGYLSKEAHLKLMLLIDGIRLKMQGGDGDDRLDFVALTCIFKLLEDLEENCLSMLISERQSNLSMLCGLLKLLTPELMMTILEIPARRSQFLSIMTKLAEFSPQQPFLFLTHSRIEPDALEMRDEKIYTIEKRFVHLTDKEINYVDTCCQMLGHQSEWSFLCDMLNSELMQYDSANNLYITMQVLKGCLNRDVEESSQSKLTNQLVESYIENIQRSCARINQNSTDETYSLDILQSVLAIETVVVAVQLHVKFLFLDDDRKVVILKDLFCPLLNWCSSSSRAVSEAALSALIQIGHLYGHDSTKSFIEEYIDYIVNGAARMLENFMINPQVTDVLAISFRLSSMDTFYYFKDLYERIFMTLAKYHHTEKSKSIALLFLRTLTILNDWFDAKHDNLDCHSRGPLETPKDMNIVIESLDINKRIVKLKKETKQDPEKLNQLFKDTNIPKFSEHEVEDEIKAGLMDASLKNNHDTATDKGVEKKEKPAEIVLTEKIVKHCIGLMSSSHLETKTLAIKAATCALKLLRNDEDTLLPLVHQIWSPLMSRLTEDYRNLEVNLCAFECLISMAIYSKDFIRRRTLDAVVPRLCLFLESQAYQSQGKKDYHPFCMTIAYKCQLKILTHMGQLAYHTDIAYTNLWRIVEVVLKYVDDAQVPSLREASLNSLKYLIALDADCVWYYAKRSGKLDAVPLGLVFESF